MTVSQAVRARRAGALTSPLLIVWREHGLFLGVIVAYLAAAVLVDRTGLVPGLARTITYTKPYLVAPAIAWIPILGTFFIDRFRVRDDLGRRIDGWAGWVASYRMGTISPQRIARLVIISLAMALFLNTFGWWKSAIPILHPFDLDPALASLDRSLHFGRHPWQWLHPLLGRPSATRWIDGLYALWLALVPCAILWQGWSRDVRTQRQFFLAFVLTWVLLGTGLATILSSAGPCYYERLLGDAAPYGELMRYLDGAAFSHDSLLARRAQEALWANYLLASDNPFVRISAMPSIHVATTLLYALAARRSNRVLWLMALGYCLVILIGSVHLGWHYALDGELSLLAVPPIWWLSGRLTASQVATGAGPGNEAGSQAKARVGPPRASSRGQRWSSRSNTPRAARCSWPLRRTWRGAPAGPAYGRELASSPPILHALGEPAAAQALRCQPPTRHAVVRQAPGG